MRSNTKNKKPYCAYCGSRTERFYSPETFAGLLEVSVEMVRKMVYKGEIAYRKIGRLVRIPSSELQRVGEYFPQVSEMFQEDSRAT